MQCMHLADLTHGIRLTSGDMRCDLAPQLGAAIAGLWWRDKPILRSTCADELTQVRMAGCYPLVPFSNRIAHARLHWNGTSHPLVQNFSPEPHSIHGVGWQRPWAVLEVSDDFALLSYEHRPDTGWPFAFDCSQAFRLGPKALEVTLSGTNQSDHAAPFGLGWHPFFVKRPDSRITFEASGRWDMDAENLPTQRVASTGLDVGCADLTVDHCFDGWTGSVHLKDALMDVRLSSSLSHLVVFTNDSRDFVAVEPVSHVNNALHIAGADLLRLAQLGVCVLQPGESLSASMRIAIGPETCNG